MALRPDLKVLDAHLKAQNDARLAPSPESRADASTGTPGGFAPELRPWMRAQTAPERDRLPFRVSYFYAGDQVYSRRLGRTGPSVIYTHGAGDPQALVQWMRDTFRGNASVIVSQIWCTPICSQCETWAAEPGWTLCAECRRDVAPSGARRC